MKLHCRCTSIGVHTEVPHHYCVASSLSLSLKKKRTEAVIRSFGLNVLHLPARPATPSLFFLSPPPIVPTRATDAEVMLVTRKVAREKSRQDPGVYAASLRDIFRYLVAEARMASLRKLVVRRKDEEVDPQVVYINDDT